MPNWAIALIILLAAVAIAEAWWILIGRRRSQHLRRRFGPEYDRVIQENRDPRRAEQILETREKRVERLHIRPLVPQERDRFVEAWQKDQSRFVDDPKVAVLEADQLVCQVMAARGYPMAEFEQRAADVSVDHPHVVENYRAAAEIAQRQKRGEATTEDLRQAMVYYRKLFDELLETMEVKR
jgi:hypothetical protein